MTQQHSTEITLTITIEANDDETFDVTCANDHDFDRERVSLADLRGAVAAVFGEAGNRLANKFAQPA